MTTPDAPTTHRLSTTLLALVAPVALVGAASAVALGWRDVLPDPVAQHWGTDGPDGFGTLTSVLLVPVVVAVLVSLLFWFIGWRAGAVTSTRRIVNGVSVGTAGLLATVILGTLDVQKGLTDAADVGGIGGVLGLAFGVGILLGALAALVTPRNAAVATTAPVPSDASRVPLGAQERVVWIRQVRGGVGLAVGIVASAGTAVLALVTGSWWMLAVPVGLVLLSASMFSWVVRVDDTGLRIRSSLGVPRTHVPLDEVVEARSTTVHALGEFGGWGWRTATDGRVGIILRSGEALEVSRTGGSRFLVTIEDSATAAGLLNALADRARTSAPVE